jgi:putative membrane protein insertion efficiency factor
MIAADPIVGGAGHPAPFASLAQLPSRLLGALISLYQRTLSPVLPVVTLGACACRFAPTCSHYAAEAVQQHGAVRGGWLALRRIVRCTPLSAGGLDPVPSAERRRPSCHRVS